MHTQFYLDQLTEVLTRKAQEFEAPWLSLFDAKVHSDPDLLFPCQPDCAINLDNCNYLHPNALTVYHGSGTPDVVGYALEDFARGAATVGSILSIGEADRAADFVKMQLEVMSQRVLSEENPYPAIFEKLLPVYCGCATTILLTGEPPVWQSMLGFTLGFIWMLSFVDISDEDTGDIVNVLFQQAKRGTYY